MRVLYISHNGMLDGLGQSQVIPYLRGLARRDVAIDLLSYELNASADAIDDLTSTLKAAGIRWTPLVRQRDSRLTVKVRESARGALRALSIALARRPDIIHGRSYLPTAVADLVATIVPGARLVFDCRGMIGDEYVDCGYWTPDRLEYRMVKRYEARAFRRAQGVVLLTRALERWARDRGWIGARTHVETIPCCVDLDRFNVSVETRERVRRELGLEGRCVVTYAGSLGSWYRESDIALFAGIASGAPREPVTFLLLTPSPTEELVQLLRSQGLAEDEIVVRSVRPPKMPEYLAAADIGVSFIRSCFSKKGSSPTKVAEYLACGLPVVLNGDIGDQADLGVERDACVVVDTFDEATVAKAVDQALPLAAAPIEERVARCRRVADTHFGLERIGVTRYDRMYRAIVASAALPSVES